MNQHQLGISVYPEKMNHEACLEYIRLAGRYGYKRIFTCLLSVADTDREALIREFRDLMDCAHENGMFVILDVNPTVLQAIGVQGEDLSFFEELHADGIRLDNGFDGKRERRMSFHTNLYLEMNSSSDLPHMQAVASYHPDLSKIITCHNFYPQRYTGISLEHFDQCNQLVRECGLHSAAFVSSNAPDVEGPWPFKEGLCTLEIHRDRPIDFQARHLFATEMIDDVIIANAPASEEEIRTLAELNPSLLTFGIVLEKELTETERQILYYEPGHFFRGDPGEYMMRSTMPRVSFAEHSIEPGNTRPLKRGDITILNDGYGRYKGELHVVMKDMPNDGRVNVIGHLPAYEHVLLRYAKPWKPFGFVEVDRIWDVE